MENRIVQLSEYEYNRLQEKAELNDTKSVTWQKNITKNVVSFELILELEFKKNTMEIPFSIIMFSHTRTACIRTTNLVISSPRKVVGR